MKTWKLLVLTLLFATPAFAGQNGLVEEWTVLFPSFQYFTWEEYLPGGSRALKEEGLVVGTGGTARLNLYDRKLMLKLKGEIFGGDVDYNGHTQNNPSNSARSFRPVNTDVVYFGVKAESDLGWRVPVNAFSIEPFAGLGYRWWLRDLQSSMTLDANGNPLLVAGSTEYWMSFYGRFGARGTWAVADDVTLFAEGGAKYTFYNENRADVPGGSVTVRPGNEWAAFGEIGVTYKRFRPSVYYEGFRYSRSSVVLIPFTTAGVYQPRSDSDIVGVNFSWVF
ncbi:MAG TPA: hypothetical protein VMJ66_02830 [Geobacteraceae bacterium]|nr:hypothetical protein [Geobacteraceae bacterium]